MSAEMPPETRAALEASIAHWERLAAGKLGERIGPADCPLCELFLNHIEDENNDCAGCPVFDKTGQEYCCDTLYATITGFEDDDGNIPYGSPEFKAAAEKELAFLISLRPAEGVK